MMFRFAQNSLAANICLAIVTTAGLFYVDILSALVISLQDGLHYTPSQAGGVASANVFGAALGGLLAVFLVKRIRWRLACVMLLGALIVIDLLSIRVAAVETLMGVRFVHGLAGGVLVGIGYSVIARIRTPERTFGMLLMIQFGLGAVGTATLPLLVLEFGVQALFLVLVAFTLLALAALPLIPDYPPRRVDTASVAGAAATPRSHRVGLIAGLLGVFLFQAAAMGLSAYKFNIGRALGFSMEFLSASGGIGMLVATLGSLLVVIVGLRWGRVWPLAIGILVAIAVRSVLLAPLDAPMFLAAVAGSTTTHAFVLPFLLGMCSAFDRIGRTATLAGFVSKLGLATGPAVGGFLLSGDEYVALVCASLVGLSVALGASVWSALTLSRANRETQPEFVSNV